MKYQQILFVCVVTFFLNACQERIKEKPINTYYDVESLINKQIEKLRNKNPQLAKTISIDGETEKDTVNFDSLGWRNELEVFKLADINKPTLRDLYLATEKTEDGMKVWSYTAEKQSLGIEFLKVYFGGDSTLTKLEARYNENNALYTSERYLEMDFDNIAGESNLTNYKVYGKQKMVMKDEVKFSIESSIL